MSCKTCKFANFQRTDTGRIKQKVAGRCVFQLGAIVAPEAMKITVSTSGIWPDMGNNCPTYELKAE